MKRRLLTLLCVMGLGTLSVKAQKTYPLVTIKDIQYVSQSDLSNCVDVSPKNGDTVRVRGVVVTSGGLAQAASGRNIWIQDGSGAWSGLDIFGSGATSPVDLANLVMGDSIEVTGVISEYYGETEIGPLTGSGINSVKLLASGRPVKSAVVKVSDLNDSKNNNQLTTGEQYEGAYVELQNVTVATVDPFSNNTRFSFHVVDANGNSINISDRFLAGRLATTSKGGTFVIPNIGDNYTSLKGVLMHSKNNCSGSTGRGYELHPFDSSDYVLGISAPSITNVTRDVMVPSSSQSVTISADVNGKRGIASVTLHYAVGVGAFTYTSVTMTNSGTSTYKATIPAQSDGSFVKFYITATDAAQYTPLTGTYPNVKVAGIYPLFYRVRDNGLSIVDVQYTPFADGTSGYVGKDVTVTGVVTASNSDLGATFIQQENQQAWAGIVATGSTALNTLKMGDKVTITGTVAETNGLTQLTNVSSVSKVGTGTITPIEVTDTTFTKYKYASNEAYESMLVTIVPAFGKKLYVVQTNADTVTGNTANYAEYRVGSDSLNPMNGTRVLAGKQGGSYYSSLNVSYINSFKRGNSDGIMKVKYRRVKNTDNMDSLRGIITYTYSNMKVLPRSNAVFFNISNAVDTSTQHHGAVTEIIGEGLNISLYPNPSAGKVNVQLDKVIQGQVSIHITDMMGRTVYAANMPAHTTQFSFDMNVPAGNYIITLNSTEGMLKKAILQISK